MGCGRGLARRRAASALWPLHCRVIYCCYFCSCTQLARSMIVSMAPLAQAAASGAHHCSYLLPCFLALLATVRPHTKMLPYAWLNSNWLAHLPKIQCTVSPATSPWNKHETPSVDSFQIIYLDHRIKALLLLTMIRKACHCRWVGRCLVVSISNYH